jgi:predicted Zn-dependent peptidase
VKKSILSAVAFTFIFLPLWTGQLEVSKFRLNNGLQVILSPDKNVQATCVLLYHLNGVKNDPLDIRGTSYLLKDLMMYLGTRNLEPYDRLMFAQRNGGLSTSQISYLKSYFIQIIPDTELDNALWLERERLDSLRMNSASLNQRKNMLYIRLHNLNSTNIHFRANQWIKKKIFEGTPYETPLFGELEKIRSINNLSLRRVYNTYKNPKSIILVITGKFDPQSTREKIARQFGQLSNSRHPPITKIKSIPPRTEYVYQNWQRERLQENFVLYGIRAPSKSIYNHLYFHALVYYLLDKRISLLEKVLNQEQKLGVKIDYEFTDYLEANSLIIKISTSQRINLERAKYFINNTFKNLRSKAIPKPEIRVLKSLMEIDFWKRMADIGQKSLILAESFRLYGDLNIDERYVKRIQNMIGFHIFRIAKTYLKKENLVLLNVISK